MSDDIKLDTDHCDFFSLNGNIAKLNTRTRNNRKKCDPFVEVTIRLDQKTFFENGDVRSLKGGIYLIAEKGKIE